MQKKKTFITFTICKIQDNFHFVVLRYLVYKTVQVRTH